MNSITKCILADQAAMSAKGLQLAAAEEMRRATIQDSQNRCMALVREFNEAPISLKFYIPTGMTTKSGVPHLTVFATIRHSALYNSLGTFMKLGMRVYLVWLNGDLVVTFNAERAHSRYVESVKGLTGDAYAAAERQASKSDRLLSLEETIQAVQNRKAGSSEDPDCAVVGMVLGSGLYTTCMNDHARRESEIFSLPTDFIHAVLQRMFPFLAVDTQV